MFADNLLNYFYEGLLWNKKQTFSEGLQVVKTVQT